MGGAKGLGSGLTATWNLVSDGPRSKPPMTSRKEHQGYVRIGGENRVLPGKGRRRPGRPEGLSLSLQKKARDRVQAGGGGRRERAKKKTPTKKNNK